MLWNSEGLSSLDQLSFLLFKTSLLLTSFACQDQTQTTEVPYELGDKMSAGLTRVSVPVCHTGSKQRLTSMQEAST